MSDLYCSIESDTSKTTTTKTGRRVISTHVRGWDFGVEIDGRMTSDGTLEFTISKTGGSNGGNSRKILCTVARDSTGKEEIEYADRE